MGVVVMILSKPEHEVIRDNYFLWHDSKTPKRLCVGMDVSM